MHSYFFVSLELCIADCCRMLESGIVLLTREGVVKMLVARAVAVGES
jgi:hypothetical protein